MKHLHERMDDIFANGAIWQHRTLRTLFDPASAEWNMTTMQEKINILQKMQEAGEKLKRVALEYQRYYQDESDRSDIANDFKNGLILITEHLLTTKSK